MSTPQKTIVLALVYVAAPLLGAVEIPATADQQEIVNNLVAKTSALDEIALSEKDPASLYEDLLVIYKQQIAAQEAIAGTYDAHLGESLAGMGRVLQNLGRYQESIAIFQRAMHIQRVNNGIYSLSQEPLLRGMITSYEAMNDVNSADEAYNQLHWIYTKSVDESNPRMIGILREKSHWHLTTYQRHPGRNSLHHLISAHDLLTEALGLVDQKTADAELTLIPLWHELVVTNYHLADYERQYPVGSRQGFIFTTNATAFQNDPFDSDELLLTGSYKNGLMALENIAVTLYQDPDTNPEDKARAVADIGDWYLLFGRHSAAQTVYKDAWNLLSEDPQTRENLFGKPRLIPLQPVNVEMEANPEGVEYLVTKLSIDAKGRAEAVEVVETYPEHNEQLADAGMREIKSLKFRPQLVNGDTVASADILYKLDLTQ